MGSRIGNRLGKTVSKNLHERPNLYIWIFCGVLKKYGHMLNAYRNIEVNKRLAAWLCCSIEKPFVDYYLCQHCANYVTLKSDVSNPIPSLDGSDPHGQVYANQLEKALLSLMPDQRAVVYLKIGLGLSNQDVADILTKSIGAVKIIQQRALIKLLHLLRPDQEIIAA